MDPRSCAQDVHRCDLCDTTIVHSYCDFCHVNLCKPCIGEHISDGYEKHTIVPFEERRSTIVYSKCRTHPQKICDLQCKNCNNNFVCSSCTASEQHRGHIFTDVLETYNTKKAMIKNDIEELENVISPKHKEIALGLEYELTNLNGGYEKITTEILKQGEDWHREIDIIINKMKTETSEIKEKHRDILQKHLNEINQTQSLIKQILLDLKEIEKSTEVSPTMEYSSAITEFCKLPPKVKVTLPTFIPKPIDRENLYSFFGHINPLSTATEENVLPLNQPNTSVRKLLDEPELVATIQTGHEKLLSVACLNEDEFWTSGHTYAIKCFNIKGSLLQTIKTKSGRWPNGIAVYNGIDLLYSDWSTKTVNNVKNGQAEELIRLQGWRPFNLCVTSDGGLLVIMHSDDKTQSKVVYYIGSTEKQTIQFDDKGHSLYSKTPLPKYITENKNHDICVSDYGASAVVVVNQDGKPRWRYTGYPSVTKERPFKPFGITSDSQSHILTADRNNNCIHILDQNGQFIHYIDNCDLGDPSGLCVDNNDNLFVTEYYKGNVKKIKFLRFTSNWVTDKE